MFYHVRKSHIISIMKVAQSTINIRMEQSLKEEAENLFRDLGLNLTTAFHMFVRQAIRLGAIPFEIKRDQRDVPLRGEAYMQKLRRSMQQAERGELIEKSMDELRALLK